MMSKQAKAFTNLFDALDGVPEDRKEKVITAAAEYLQEIRRLQTAGASPEEIRAAGDAIYAKYV